MKGGAEPVILQAAVEHDFERTEEGRDQHEADDVESDALLRRLAGGTRGLAQDDRNQRHRHHADRRVDQKAPLPGEIVGQPAAERRPDHRRHHHGDAEHRKGLAALRRRKRIGQDRLRDRHHAAAAETLQDAEQQQRIQVRRKPAQHRAKREQSETDQEEGFAAEHSGEEARGRQDDGVGDQIGGDHPGRFVLAHPHAAGDVG